MPSTRRAIALCTAAKKGDEPTEPADLKADEAASDACPEPVSAATRPG
ncbi:MAG: hypothetical protein AAGF11_10740 [Myxococcota bacterium]